MLRRCFTPEASRSEDADPRLALVELPAIAFLQERQIRGSMMGGVRPAIDIPNYVDLYLAGKLKLDALVSRRRPLAEINEAVADMNRGELARTVIDLEI